MWLLQLLSAFADISAASLSFPIPSVAIVFSEQFRQQHQWNQQSSSFPPPGEQSPKQTLSAQEVKQEWSDVFKKVTKNELNCRKQLCFSSQNSLSLQMLYLHSNPQKPIPQQHLQAVSL